ncbi:MAG: CDP-alcohol phosphatidyltransferase family protein [Acidobacteriia bacterium]|nr:CDP-alcohol phosphatidyltransferase family protein [Terriglobia bacterium]
MEKPKFADAARAQHSILAPLEKKTLIWLAHRMPAWVNSDHLTVLGFLGMFLTGLAYWWARWNKAGLLWAIVCLAVNWFGDSLDGTLARVRNKLRPRYGFYVDHVVDTFGAFFLLSGLALSGYMHWKIAMGLLIAFYGISIEVYLAAYTLGTFHLSHFKLGPTELRVLMCIGNVFLIYHPMAVVFGHRFQLFDVGGFFGICGIGVMMLAAVFRNTRTLYRAEPIQ